MPSHEEHCQDSLKRYGKRFDELHHWLDEPSTMLANGHRIHRHDPVSTPKLAKELFGELAEQACLDHIRLDKKESARKRREDAKKPKKPKKGYWEDHEFHRISMTEVVTNYCGDDILLELADKCELLERKVDVSNYIARNRALISALFLTGGRVREVLTLKKNNFDFDNEEAERNNAFLVRDMDVLKRGRSGKPILQTRTFPIWNDEPLVKHLKSWVKSSTEDLFPSTRKKTIDPTYAFKIVRQLGELLTRPLHINTMWFRKQRHFYLVEKKGFSPYDLQAYFKLRNPPKIYRTKEDWQNLLAVCRPQRQEKFYQKVPYEALRDIQKLLKSAKADVGIIDPYVDDSLFELYLDYINPNARIRIITENMYQKFKEVAKRFKIQKPFFEVRTVPNVHDRYLIIDNRVWIVGSSLNTAGLKPLYLIELNDSKRIINFFERLWTKGKKEF